MQPPKDFLGEIIWNEAAYVPMRNIDPHSNEAVAARLKLLRWTVARENQTEFARRLKIEVKRWNNFERGYPLSKEVAFQIVGKFPYVTTDWLWLGRTGGLPTSFQRELEEAEKASTGAERASR